jgi:hypothetical protein
MKSETKFRDTHLKFNLEEWQRLEDRAKQDNRTVSNLIKTILAEWFKKN